MKPLETANRYLQYATVLCSGWFAAVFIYVAFLSANYPFHLEWMEGHTVDIIQRLRDGLPFYDKPTLEYVPYIYTPYYFYLSAFVSFFTGVDFLAGRLVSIASTLGTVWIMYRWIRAEGGDRLISCVAGGLYLATYALSARWFDVARVDSLYLFLMVAGLYVFYFNRNRYGAVLSACLFAAAFFTKQSAVLALFPCFVVALYIQPRQALIAGATAAVIMLGGCIWLEITSKGWFSFYVYDVPAGHADDGRKISSFWMVDLLPNVAIMMVVSMCTLIAACIIKGHKSCLWYGAIVLGFLGSSYLSRVHSFGHLNVIMPAHFAFSLLSALLPAMTAKRYAIVAAGASLAIIGQFTMLRYDPAPFIPNQQAIARGNALLDEIKTYKGDVMFSELQYVQPRVGKKTFSIGMAGFDVMRSDLKGMNHVKYAYVGSLINAVRKQKFDAIVTGYFLKVNELREHYYLLKTIDNPQEFVTGGVYFSRANIFVPKKK